MEAAYKHMTDSASLSRLVTSYSLAPLNVFVAMRTYLSRYGFRDTFPDEDPVIYAINILGRGSSRLRHAAKLVTAATGIRTTVATNSQLGYDPDESDDYAQEAQAELVTSPNIEKATSLPTSLNSSN
jgi:hypothetical protein